MGTVRVERCPQCQALIGEGMLYEHMQKHCAMKDAPPMASVQALPAKPRLDKATRLAISELVRAAECAAESKDDAVIAFGMIMIRRAVDLARGVATPDPYTQQACEEFIQWWNASPGYDNDDFMSEVH